MVLTMRFPKANQMVEEMRVFYERDPARVGQAASMLESALGAYGRAITVETASRRNFFADSHVVVRDQLADLLETFRLLEDATGETAGATDRLVALATALFASTDLVLERLRVPAAMNARNPWPARPS